MTSFKNPSNPFKFKVYDFLHHESYVDVTLVADGRFLQAHKLVLAASSKYFEEIFSIIPDKHPAIVLKDIAYKHLQLMLQYIYCGCVDIEECDVEAFRKTLDSLKIEYDQQQDDDICYDEKSNAVDSEEPEFLESEDMVDVEDTAWSDANEVTIVKVEPEDEREDNEESNRTEKKSSLTSPRELHEKIINFRRIIPKPEPLHEAIREYATYSSKISIGRVVPSKANQEFMNRNVTTCPFCRKLFKNTKHRNEHVKYCVDNSNRIVSECHLCKKSVCDPYYLRKHMKNVHGLGPTSND